MLDSKFRKCFFKVWEEEGCVKAEVRFVYLMNIFVTAELAKATRELLVNFRDLLVKNVSIPSNAELLKHEGQPTELDSIYMVFDKNDIGYFKGNIDKRDLQLQKEIEQKSLFIVETDHGFPYIWCQTKIHSKDELIKEIKKVAQELEIELKPL
jgi:hypothetical protein